MTDYPTITRGLGKLTPELWDRIMNALRFVEQVAPELQVKRPDQRGRPGPGTSVRLFRILDSLELDTNRWEYGWATVRLDGTSFAPTGDGLSHATEGYGRGVNSEEAANGFAEFGYGNAISTPLANILVEPLANQRVVPGIIVPDGNGDGAVLRPVFMPASNPIVVECT
jgi:hypothetical protein